MRKLLASALFCACSAVAQTTGAVVNQTEGPPAIAFEELHFRDGAGNYEYQCIANAKSVNSIFTRAASTSNQPKTTVAVATLTSIEVATDVGTVTTSVEHGLAVGQRVVVSGATVDTDLNGTYTIRSVPSGTTFTVDTSSVADATYNEATLRFVTSAPRTNANVWAIRKRFYTGTGFDRSIWINGSVGEDLACDSRESY